MLPFVYDKLAALRKFQSARVTSEWFFAGVNPHVGEEVGIADESLVTQSTHE